MPAPRAMGLARSVLSLCLLVLTDAGSARAKVQWDVGGRLQSDLRFRLGSVGVGQWVDRRELVAGVSRNENIAKLRLVAESGRFLAVSELDFVWLGFIRDVDVFDDLTRREKTDPYRLEAQAIYLEASDIFVDGLDLRIGQQRVNWGKGDQFNPTNTLNAMDLEDPLLFGDQVANAMVRMDYSPHNESGTFSLVLVPAFKPALLPRSAQLALAALDRLPFTSDALRQRIHAEQSLLKALGYPTVLQQAHIAMPSLAFENMQFAARIATNVAGQDVALSYYVGRHDLPLPFVNRSRLDAGRRCDPADESKCIEGTVRTEVTLGYRRMQVVGLNVAGQLDFVRRLWAKLRPLGYWLELGVFFPQPASIALLQEQMEFGFYTQPAGEYDYGLDGRQPEVVSGTPFAKWVLGVDYSFGSRTYANLQWVHGLPDEFGAGDFFSEGWSVRAGSAEGNEAELLSCALGAEPRGQRCAVEVLRPRLGDYLVVGVDVKFLQDELLARLFVVLDLNGVTLERWSPERQRRVRNHHGLFSSDGFSAVVFPQLSYNFGHGVALAAGALLNLGKEQTKFGDPATGGSQVWLRSRVSF